MGTQDTTLPPLPDERASFEEWAKRRCFDLTILEDDESDEYKELETESAWEAWQARAAIAAQAQQAQGVPAVQLLPVQREVKRDWRLEAAEFLHMKADEQERINRKNPDHAECYPSWKHRADDRRRLASLLEQLACASPFGLDCADPTIAAAPQAEPPGAKAVSVSVLQRMQEFLKDQDIAAPGFHRKAGWNAALQRAMDYAQGHKAEPQPDKRRIDDYATQINRLRNVIQSACLGGTDAMVERWEQLFPDEPVPTVKKTEPLSSEQIEALPVWAPFVGLWPQSREEITRAVEQAHGIGTKGGAKP